LRLCCDFDLVKRRRCESPTDGRGLGKASASLAERGGLKAQGFRLVPDSCNWTNAAGDDAGIYSIDGYWGEVKGWRVEINRRSPKPAGGLSRRHMLAGLAALPAALPAAAASGAEPDLAFVLIAEKLAADVAHCEAIDAQGEIEGARFPISTAWEKLHAT
jgi:hypothetical protein